MRYKLGDYIIGYSAWDTRKIVEGHINFLYTDGYGLIGGEAICFAHVIRFKLKNKKQVWNKPNEI